MRVAAIAAAAVLLTAGTASAGLFDDDCRYTADRRAAAPANGVTKVVIRADSGSLKVDGVSGASQVVASGTACTSDQDFLERMTLKMNRSGSVLYIDSTYPKKTVMFGFFSARLDFSVTLPENVPVEIDDDSGWIKVTKTGALTIDDDSGSIEATDIRGSVTIDDDSGSIEVNGVRGSVAISDDSGEIVVKNVSGNVEISDDSGGISVADVEGMLRIRDDDSGSISVKNVRRDVIVERDSSGSIDVADVGGNFTVGRKSSGHVDFVRVAGKVSLPERD